MMSVDDLLAYRRKHLQQSAIPPITLSAQHYDLTVRELTESDAVREYFASETLIPTVEEWLHYVERGLRLGRISLCGVRFRRAVTR